MFQLLHTSSLPLTPAEPEYQHSAVHKLTTGLILVIALAVVAKLLSIWGQDYIEKAQNNLADNLWLTENRGMTWHILCE